jgi:tryptophan-rich sensory protein
MYFITMILLGFLWYPLFFVTARLALAALLSLAVTVLALLCALSYWRISRVAGALMLLHVLYLLILSVWGIALLLTL